MNIIDEIEQEQIKEIEEIKCKRLKVGKGEGN